MTIELATYLDAYHHLEDVMDVTAGPELRTLKNAIVTAYRLLPNSHRWAYYDRQYTLASEASQTTGTVTYVDSSRELTLSGATWPSNATRYRVYINDKNAWFPIASRTSSTVVVLDANQNPGSDITTASSYTLSRTHYPFPANFRKMYKILDGKSQYEVTYVDPPLITAQETYWQTPDSQPAYCTIAADGEYYGALSIVFSSPPAEERFYHLHYQASPRPLKVFEENAGTGTWTAASTTVTGSSTAFADKHVGSVIKLGEDGTNPPTAVWGDYPYEAYRIISAVASATSLTLDAVPGVAQTAKKFTISDPLDMTSDSMLTYFLRSCEYQAAILMNRQDVQQKYTIQQNALKDAMAADARWRGDSGHGGIGSVPYHLRGWSTVPVERVTS
mgnify:CR=1 FL=1